MRYLMKLQTTLQADTCWSVGVVPVVHCEQLPLFWVVEIAAAMINQTELPPTIDSAEDTPLYPHGDRRSLRRTVINLVASSRDIIVAVIACLGAMSMGFALGYSSPALEDDYIKQLLSSPVSRSWFGSLLTVGAMIGGPLGGLFVGRVGRKTTLILCNVPLALGWFLIIYATNVVLLYTGRYWHTVSAFMFILWACQ